MKKTPQLLGIALFIVLNLIIFSPKIFESVFISDLIPPIPPNPNIRTSPPREISRFGEILAREYTREEKIKIENAALANSQPSVLGASTSATPTVSIENLHKFHLVSSKEGKISLAVLGDSMVDTLQHELPQLKILLAQAYPNITFKLYNFGVGATNIESGLQRLTNEYDYLGTHYPSVLSVSPDILVIESFAYNPRSNSQSDLDWQWHTLSQMLDTVKSIHPTTKIILAATIAPNGNTFGDGVLNWLPQDKKNKAITIRSYLQNMVNFASSTKLPLADAYHASLQEDGEGDSRFIDASDHLHPSGEGGFLFSQKVVEAIANNKLIE